MGLRSHRVQSVDPISDSISFMNNPEIIRMHLDILYKSVPFLNKERIDSYLGSYKANKERKK